MSGFEFNEDMALKLVFQRADDPEPIGVLDLSVPEMTFTGRADESAKVFFDAVIKNRVGWTKHLEDVRSRLEPELAAAKAELSKKVEELAAAWMVKDDLLAELAKVRQQRDKARRMYCNVIAESGKDECSRLHDRDDENTRRVADALGWDWHSQQEGGGA